MLSGQQQVKLQDAQSKAACHISILVLNTA